ncbi:DUF3489 domain-containing protein [Azospirillum argentinense]|uniref:DUF3489 domain-containing protein n=1 Tax=Azospirillum brasilense TaxID=192 RepID=A0A4D8QGQ9_AZOBR|nr:DUF3489 domain-containing protein [Azospirillum argentinense]QCO07410.1 DUF3489 domain-containing protein [Azospirillum argentinense]
MSPIRDLSGPNLVALYNALAEASVKRFETRAAGIKRVIDHISQYNLDDEAVRLAMAKACFPTVPQDDDVPTAPPTMVDVSSPGPVVTSPYVSPEPSPRFPKPGTKPRIIIDLVCREGGATMVELITATGWKRCSGTLSVLNRTFGLGVRREKGGDGVTRFQGRFPVVAVAGPVVAQ